MVHTTICNQLPENVALAVEFAKQHCLGWTVVEVVVPTVDVPVAVDIVAPEPAADSVGHELAAGIATAEVWVVVALVHLTAAESSAAAFVNFAHWTFLLFSFDFIKKLVIYLHKT